MSSQNQATGLLEDAEPAPRPRLSSSEAVAEPAVADASTIAARGGADDLSTIVDRVSFQLVRLTCRRKRVRNLKRAAVLFLVVLVMAGAGVGGWYGAWYAGAPIVNPLEWLPTQLAQLRAR